jgi:hypothetical protein
MPNYNSTARVPFKRGGAVSGTKLKQVKEAAAKTKAGTKKGLKVLKVVGSILTPLGVQGGKKFRDKKAEGGRIGLKKGTPPKASKSKKKYHGGGNKDKAKKSFTTSIQNISKSRVDAPMVPKDVPWYKVR